MDLLLPEEKPPEPNTLDLVFRKKFWADNQIQEIGDKEGEVVSVRPPNFKKYQYKYQYAFSSKNNGGSSAWSGVAILVRKSESINSR